MPVLVDAWADPDKPCASFDARILPETATPSSSLNENLAMGDWRRRRQPATPDVRHEMLTTAPFTTVNVNGSS
jgi:hypothetical protein